MGLVEGGNNSFEVVVIFCTISLKLLELEWTCQLIIMSNLFILLHAEVHCSQALFYELHVHDDGYAGHHRIF